MSLAVAQDQIGILLRKAKTDDGGIVGGQCPDDMPEFMEKRDDLGLKRATVEGPDIKVSPSAGVISHRAGPLDFVDVASGAKECSVRIDGDRGAWPSALPGSGDVGTVLDPASAVMMFLDDMLCAIFVDCDHKR